MAQKFLSLKSIDNYQPIESNNIKSQPELTLGQAQSFPERRSPHKNGITVLPNFPEFSRGSIRKSLLLSKTPKTEAAPLGLFPLGNATTTELTEEIRQKMYSRIGVPKVIIPVNSEKPQITSPSPTNQNSGSKNKEKESSFKEVVASPKQQKSPKQDSPSPSMRKKTDYDKYFAPTTTPPTNKLMKKLASGRAAINNLSEEELIDLAIEILQKQKNERSNIDISILTRYLSNVDFFKKQDSKVTEGCLKAMYHISLPAGESVFNIGDQGTTFWVLLKGSVGVWLPTDQSENNKRNVEIVLKEARTLHAGSAFGEVALAEKGSRTATIICKEDCEFAVLDQAPFKEIMKEVMDHKLFEEANFLATLPLFKSWPFNDIKFLFYSSPIVSYKRGAVIYDEGSHPEKMYIIKKGTFKVLKEIDIEEAELYEEVNKIKKSNRAKKIVELGILGEKEVFGEDELFDFAKRKYKIVCDSLEAEVFEISTKEFRTRILDSEDSKKWLTNHMAAKKRYYEERSKSIANATHKHKHLWFFNRDSPVPKPSTRLLSRTNNTLLNNTSESPFTEEEKPLTSNYPKIKTTFRQGFLGENPKFTIPISTTEDTEVDYERNNIKNRADTKSRHRKVKTLTCPTSPVESRIKDMTPPPLEFDLLKRAIEERNYKSKKSTIKGQKIIKSFSKEKLKFHDSIIQGLTKNNSIDFDENDALTTLNFEKSRTNSPFPSPSPTLMPIPSIAILETPLPSVQKRKERFTPTLKGFNSGKHAIKLATMETTPEIEVEQKSSVKYLQYPPIEPVNNAKSGLSLLLGGDPKNDELFRMMAQHTESGSLSVKFDKSRDYSLHVDGIKGSARLNLEAQRNKWKGIIQDKAGKDFRKMFYSRDESVSLEKTEIFVQQHEGGVLKPHTREIAKEKGLINKYGTYSPKTQFLRLQTAYEGLKKVVNPSGPNIAIKGEKMKKI